MTWDFSISIRALGRGETEGAEARAEAEGRGGWKRGGWKREKLARAI